jgi:heat shock protein HslJ
MVALALLLPIGAAACGSASSRPAPPAVSGGSPSLVKTSWILVTLGPSDRPKAVVPGTEITATFGEEPGRVVGSAGCNSYGGSYTEQDGKLTVSSLVSTKKFCTEPEGVMPQEQEYLASLEAAESYRVQGAILEITTKDGRLLRFREKI